MIDIRDVNGHLLMRYDPENNAIEIQRRGIKTIVDLNQYQRSAMSAEEDIKRIKQIVHDCILNLDAQRVIRAEVLSIDDCIDLIRDMSDHFSRTNKPYPTLSAMSAAHQAVIHGGRTDK